MKRLYILLSLALIAFAPLVFVTGQAAALSLVAPHIIAASPQQEICNGVGLTTADGTCGDGGLQLNGVLGVAVTLLSVIIGIVAVIMIIIAGLRFITSG